MTATRDKFGRPIVVVTGMGVVTSLGSGKADNWKKLTAGESGIRTITRFPTDGLKTTMAGTIDFVPVEPFSSTDLSERLGDLAAEEAIAQAAIGTKGDFPGPLFLAVAPVEIEWPQRQELGRAIGGDTEIDYDAMLRVSGGGRFTRYHRRFLFGSVADHLAEKFGTKGSPISLSTACASGASAIQLGVEAIRRGEADAALCVATDGSVNPEALVRFSLLSALSTHNDPPQAAAGRFRRTATVLSWPKAPARWCWKAMRPPPRAAPIFSASSPAAANWPIPSTAPAPAPTASRSSAACATRCRMPASSRTRSTTSTRTAPGRRKTTRWNIWASRRVFGERATQIPVSSNKSMVGHTLSAAGAVEAVFSLLTLEHQRIPPTINYDVPDPAIPFDVVPNKARDARVTAVMSNSFGFGGQNASLILTREPV